MLDDGGAAVDIDIDIDNYVDNYLNNLEPHDDGPYHDNHECDRGIRR